MTSRGARLTSLILAIALGQFLFLRARSAWTNHWLLNDAQQGSAVVTKELWSGHNAVGYEYLVGDKEYSGRSGRNWKNQKMVQIGENTTVYFSASHPWLSLLYKPEVVLEGLPVTMIVLVLEVFAVITIVRPKSRLALSLIDRERNSGT